MEITFTNGTLLSIKAGQPTLYKYPNDEFRICGLDESQRDLMYKMLELIQKADSDETCWYTDTFFQRHKKRLPLVVAEALYSELVEKFKELKQRRKPVSSENYWVNKDEAQMLMPTNQEFLKIGKDGSIYIKGQLAESDKDVVDALREWARMVTGPNFFHQ